MITNGFNSYFQNGYNPPSQLTYVKGLDGAKQYQLGPNSEIALFDDDNDVFYIKKTGPTGEASYNICDFTVRETHQLVSSNDFVSKDEFSSAINEIKKLIGGLYNGQQSQTEFTAAANRKQTAKRSTESSDRSGGKTES